VAWDTFRSRPITGIGLDRFHSAAEAAHQAGQLTESYRVIDPHSTIPGRLAEAGVIGAITMLALWCVAGMETMRLLARVSAAPWMLTAVAAGLAGTLINSVNVDVMNFRFLWVALGLVRGLGEITKNK
jgi:O-antigen ligase